MILDFYNVPVWKSDAEQILLPKIQEEQGYRSHEAWPLFHGRAHAQSWRQRQAYDLAGRMDRRDEGPFIVGAI